jgi:aminoglycoside-2''-adenylyltransferase
MTDPTSTIQLRLIGELTRVLDGEGIGFWLAGGWAVDFHLGRINRAHSDIDLVVNSADGPGLMRLLGDCGYRPRPAEQPEAVVQFERDGYVVEITFITQSPTGATLTPGYEHWPWNEGSFPLTTVTFGDIRLRAMSVAGLLAQKSEWQRQLGQPPRPHDLRDIEALRLLLGS